MNEILKIYDLKSKEDFFDLIVQNYIDRKSAMAKHMFHLLTSEYRREFFEYVDTAFFYEDDYTKKTIDMNSLYVFLEEDVSPWTNQNDDEESENNSWQIWK
jgi:hypothetical protein